MRVRVAIAVLILFAALMPVVPVIFAVLITLAAPLAVRLTQRAIVVCDDQPVALLALVSFRAPPRAAFA